MSQAVIFCGIQGVGKSTFFKRSVFVATHTYISLDVLKKRPREQAELDRCLAEGLPFVIDNTNPTIAERRRYIEPALELDYFIVGYYFRSSAKEAIAINEERIPHKQVPLGGILGTFNKLEKPSFDEGFDALFYVSRDGNGGFSVRPWMDG